MAIGIYIHIPFCAAKCNYCDFNSHVSSFSEREKYIDALCLEIEKYEKDKDYEADTVFFGGGTPTVLEPEQLTKILRAVKNRFKLTKNCEITTECNPATINRAGLLILRKAGFNRISIGMQSANDVHLKKLGRIHSFKQCRECVKSAREAGFENLSVDLMFGLPEQSLNDWADTLKEALNLNAEHISCYALKLEEGTPFAAMKLNIADEDESRNMYEKCVGLLSENGYHRYEISNFAKDGYESRHNKKYWQGEGYIGFGVSAASCVDGKRFLNIENTKKYVENIKENKSVMLEQVCLTAEDEMSEFVYLGLRMDKGISVSEFRRRFAKDIFDVYEHEIKKNMDRGTIIRDGDMLRIAPEFIYVCNSILADFV